ncbi:hypothetical protein [Salinispora sp. H7-4]|uniref:hypothetical protein n=1 Tax=Salinispora sp. H7-4 TaxID=2748321 RepID=UPI0015D1298D|nr:hypothetical protein [Salinispora sp. H7-4]NYT94003.1 hypothetical protein [Salinispora sp. H7-4]
MRLHSLHTRIFRSAAGLVALLGIGSCTALLSGTEPRSGGLDPETLRSSLIGALAVFGVLVPGVLALLRSATRPTRWGPAALFLAGATSAAVLGAIEAEPPLSLTLGLAIAVSLLVSTIGLVGFGEHPANQPARGRF